MLTCDIAMGDIPAKNNMISSIITFPQNGQTIEADQTFDFTVQVNNLVAGEFTNPDNTYYSAPQFLQGGKIVGHCHITCQDLGNTLNPAQPPNPSVFAFFKGINDAGNGNGALSATVEGGLPAGNYRVCTINSGANHQPVVMPVAQRGQQDDCTKFTVAAGGGKNNGQQNNNNNNNGKNNGQQNQDQNAGKQNNAGDAAANQGKNNGQQNQGQQNQGKQNQGGQNQGKGQGKRRAARMTMREMARRREFVA